MDDGQGASALQAASGGQVTPSMVQQAHGVTAHHGNVVFAGGDVNLQNFYHGQPEPTMNSITDLLRLIPNLRKIHLDVLSKATPGTAIWILKTKNFLLWLDPNGNLRVLWGTGIPGAGKSVMASVVINDLEARAAASGGSICVAYVYFRYSDAAGLTLRGVLEILVKQIVERNSKCAVLAERAYARHLKERTQPTEAELLQLLHRFTEVIKVTFYVLDALDEAPEKLQADTVRVLATLNVKLFITSRPLKAVEAKAPRAETHSFTIVAQDGDLDLHIAQEISRSPNLEDLLDADASFKEQVVSSVKTNCDGMFLHASLQLDAISRCRSAHDVIETLEQFPSNIKDVYYQTWSRICSQTQRDILLAKAVLVWVLNAARSMTIEELRHAVATHPDTHKFEAKRLVPASALVTLCCGLITVEEETKLVRLVHYTAKGPLKDLLCESFPHPDSLLASVCITHLAECGFQNTAISSEEEFSAALQGDTLLAYASDAWSTHAGRTLDTDESRLLTANFISGCKAFPSFTSPDRTYWFDIISPLHILALHGLPLSLVAHSGMDDPNVRTRIEKASPLSLAAWCGNISLVEDLLCLEEIQVNLVDKDGCSPLILAATRGHERIVKLFLSHPDIQVNLVGNKGMSALMEAAYFGYESVVKAFLAHLGIQVNLVDNKGQSALMKAAHFGYESVVELLLAHPDIQVNLVDNEAWSALMLAASAGHESAVELLLAYPDIQVNSVDEGGRSALMNAAGGGHESVVKLLLVHPDIQVNLVDNEGWSALMNAAHFGHEGIVKLLLAHPDINVNLVDNEGWSALMQAASEGHESVVKLHLAHPDIKVSLVDNEPWSALMNAAYFGYECVVQLLLVHPGIQVNLISVKGYTALALAQQQGHDAIVQLLSSSSTKTKPLASPSDTLNVSSSAILGEDSEVARALQDLESQESAQTSREPSVAPSRSVSRVVKDRVLNPLRRILKRPSKKTQESLGR